MSRYVEITDATVSAATYIAANLRPADIDEMRAVFGPDADHPAVILTIADRSRPFSYVAKVAGEPVMVFGVLTDPAYPHLAMAWGMGTRKTPRAIPGVSKFVTQEMIPMLRGLGIRRVEVRVLQSKDFAARWIEQTLGAEFEAELWKCGFQGETFLQFAWTTRKFPHVHLPEASDSGAVSASSAEDGR